jgi:hypothetical protein
MLNNRTLAGQLSVNGAYWSGKLFALNSFGVLSIFGSMKPTSIRVDATMNKGPNSQNTSGIR